MANKTKRIQIRISETDLKKIDSRAAKANLTRTDFMVAASINKPVVNIDGGQEIAKQLYKLGVNINQIAMLGNRNLKIQLMMFYRLLQVKPILSVKWSKPDIKSNGLIQGKTSLLPRQQV